MILPKTDYYKECLIKTKSNIADFIEDKRDNGKSEWSQVVKYLSKGGEKLPIPKQIFDLLKYCLTEDSLYDEYGRLVSPGMKEEIAKDIILQKPHMKNRYYMESEFLDLDIEREEIKKGYHHYIAKWNHQVMGGIIIAKSKKRIMLPGGDMHNWNSAHFVSHDTLLKHTDEIGLPDLLEKRPASSNDPIYFLGNGNVLPGSAIYQKNVFYPCIGSEDFTLAISRQYESSFVEGNYCRYKELIKYRPVKEIKK